MVSSTADMVEEALGLIENGTFKPEDGPQRYGENWPNIRPAVETALRVTAASNPPIVSQRPFVPLDKAAGWQALKAQLEVAPQMAAPLNNPVRPVSARPQVGWLERFAHFFSTRFGRATFGAAMGMALVAILVIGVSSSLPGDVLYKAKLGWDYLGEATNLDPNDRAQAAFTYADRRLNELEKLAFVGKPDQIAEVQGQYLRGLQAGLRYTDQKNFTAFSAVYNRLNTQRERVYLLQQNEYSFGPRSQLLSLADQLDKGVFNLAPRLPGAPPVSVSTSPAASPSPTRNLNFTVPAATPKP